MGAASGSGRRLGGRSAVGGVCTNWTNQNDECSSDWISVDEMDVHQQSNASESPAASTGQARVSFAWRDVEVSSSDGGLGSSPSGVPSPLRAVNCLLNTQKVKRARPSDRKIVYSVCNYAR